MHFDIFNGDADGICALQQLRLVTPIPHATLITGVKRDIKLLAREELQSIEGCSLTVLDVSMDSNQKWLTHLLERNNTVTYIDHHSAASIPDNRLLQANIVLSADTCTSLLANQELHNLYSGWAICGAFGDNLHTQALQLASELSLNNAEIDKLREIGELLNYNGYGASISDLHFHPEQLYRAVAPFENPLTFFDESDELKTLRQGFVEDMAQALACSEYPNSAKNRIYIFPEAPWARRIAGVFANLKAREKGEAAHALITENDDSTIRISVRAPMNDKRDAATLCKKFPTGGGREAAAGINNMPADMLEDFIKAFNSIYS